MATKTAGAVEALVSEVAAKVKGQTEKAKARFASTHSDPKARPTVTDDHVARFINDVVDQSVANKVLEAFKADVQAAL